MIKIAKRPFFKYQKHPCFSSVCPEKYLTYFFLPAVININPVNPSATMLILFYLLINAFLIFYLLKKNYLLSHRLETGNEDLQEAINIMFDQNSKEEETSRALVEKIERYRTFQKIIADIHQNPDLDYIANNLASIAFSLVGRKQGCCILYLVEEETQKLVLFKSKKEDKKLVIKAKEGDIFDSWILRHTSPLFIDDAGKDFRFDLERVKREEVRPIYSLISAPFIIGRRFLGILRLDSALPNFYCQDDLRFLVTVCDLGAFALENGELFAKTQNLAIHDGLTSVYTKDYFLGRLSEECKRSQRQDRICSLLMLDIDYFKNYNDKFGHTAGDILLKGLCAEMTEFFDKKSAVIGRFGGEEFCVILLERDKKEAYRLAEGLRQRIQDKKLNLRRQETSVTVSIGVASFPSDASDGTELIIKVDRAMYEAKQKGRNQVVVSR